MTERRVVVTGIGVVSPFGVGYDAFRNGLLEGRNAISPISLFDASRSPVKVAGEARGYDDALLPSDPRHHVVLSRSMRLGLVAAAECVARAGLDEEARRDAACLMAIDRYDITLEDFGESFARSMRESAEAPLGYAFDRTKYLSRGHRAAHPLWLLKFIPNLAAAHVVRTFGLEGEANTYTGEAAASIQLLGHAAASIREGLYDVALCGGCDSRITPIGFERYLSLGLLAPGDETETAISMPFDRARRGYVLGEAAVFFALESLERALERGATPVCELLGWGDGSDAFHPYRAHPEGRGIAGAMTEALRLAKVDVADVDAVVAAAPSLEDVDAAEATAIASVFGSHAPAVTAPAGAIGRTHVASGAVAAAAAAVAIEAQRVPPTTGTTDPDDRAPAGLVTSEARERRVRAALANAWSFGGQCASILLGEVRA
jgi:3-oxoacyl-[acyl-carrier-protein] synthase II